MPAVFFPQMYCTRYRKKIVIYKNNVVFLWPLSTGDVRWQDGQIKEEEDVPIVSAAVA
jgi:hypothetical protein